MSKPEDCGCNSCGRIPLGVFDFIKACELPLPTDALLPPIEVGAPPTVETYAIRFRMTEPLFQEGEFKSGVVLESYRGPHPVGSVVLLGATADGATLRGTYVPEGSTGYAIRAPYSSGPQNQYEIITYDKPATLVKARLVTTYGPPPVESGVLPARLNYQIIEVTDLVPIYTHGGNFFKPKQTDIIKVAKITSQELSGGDYLILAFDLELARCCLDKVYPYFVLQAWPGPGSTGPSGSGNVLVIPPP